MSARAEDRSSRRRCDSIGRARDRGAATVLATTLAGVLLVLVALGSLVGDLLMSRARAAAAADLAALAAVPLSPRGPEVACRTAGLIARDNGATMVACDVVGSQATVRVSVAPQSVAMRWLLRVAADGEGITVAARAGAAPRDAAS